MVEEVARSPWMKRCHAFRERLPPGPRKVVITILGTALLMVGAAMMVLPGPGLLGLAAGLLLLSTEYRWAHNLVQRFAQLLRRFRRPPTRHRNDPQERGLREVTRRGFGVPLGP